MRLWDMLRGWHFSLKIFGFGSSLGLFSSLKYYIYWHVCRVVALIAVGQPGDTKARFFNSQGFYVEDLVAIDQAQLFLDRVAHLDVLDWDHGENSQILRDHRHSDVIAGLGAIKAQVESIGAAILGTDVDCFFSKVVKSLRTVDTDGPKGSQMWHNDGGPGICLNFAIYPTSISEYQGGTEILNKSYSKIILIRAERVLRRSSTALSKAQLRVKRDKFIRRSIASVRANVFKYVSVNPGILVFSNNLLHKGGYPCSGEERIVILAHVYPRINAKFDLDFPLKSKGYGYPSVSELLKMDLRGGRF